MNGQTSSCSQANKITDRKELLQYQMLLAIPAERERSTLGVDRERHPGGQAMSVIGRTGAQERVTGEEKNTVYLSSSVHFRDVSLYSCRLSF
jgi:hypothetical protein